MSVKQRLIEFIKYNKIGQKKFAQIVGLSDGYVNAIRKSIQPDTLHRISMQFPELNTGWLMTGNGDMIIKPENLKEQNRVGGDEKMIAMPREVFDQISKLTETILSQQKTIETLTETNKKIVVQAEDNATCADASGSGIIK